MRGTLKIPTSSEGLLLRLSQGEKGRAETVVTLRKKRQKRNRVRFDCSSNILLLPKGEEKPEVHKGATRPKAVGYAGTTITACMLPRAPVLKDWSADSSTAACCAPQSTGSSSARSLPLLIRHEPGRKGQAPRQAFPDAVYVSGPLLPASELSPSWVRRGTPAVPTLLLLVSRLSRDAGPTVPLPEKIHHSCSRGSVASPPCHS